jgi:hypothetical protein
MNPKWSLTHPRGDMMVIEAIKGIEQTNISRICVIGLAEHNERFRLVDTLTIQFTALGLMDKVSFVLLDEPTRNQPETVVRGIELGKISGPIYVKDSDNYFRHSPSPGNAVAGYDLHKIDHVNPRNKSYFEVNGDGMIVNIVEKRIVSSKFCTGGYSFESAALYKEYFDRLSGETNLYISHIIYSMMLDKIGFTASEVQDYIDWGTIHEWREYTNLFTTLFVDLDGTIVYNSGQFGNPRWGQTDGIQPNIQTLNHLHDSGKVEIIVTTSRKESFRDITVAQLERVGLKYHRIIFDLPHAKRIVINDYSPSNPYKSCDAINLKRDSGSLKEMLEDSIGRHLDVSIGAEL